jgi:hypothetical protein
VSRGAVLTRLGAALLVLAFAGCRPSPAPSSPRVESWRAVSPSELFPDDLDFVARIDAARIRQNPMLSGVVSDLAKTSRSEMLASVKTAFGEASAVWIGTRWMSDGFHGDGILAIEGMPGGDVHPTTLEDATRGAGDNGAGPSALLAREGDPSGIRASRRVAVPLREADVFERSASSRGEAVLEVVLRGRGLVLATAAEADAVLRVMRSAPDEGRLDPPARGLLSFAGRLRDGAPFAAAPSGALRELTEGLVGYVGSIEERDAIEVEASLSYASAKEAGRAAERAKEAALRLAAAGGSLRTMADSMQLTEVGSSLRVRVTVPFAWLGELH